MEIFKKSLKLMGNAFEISAVGTQEKAEFAIEKGIAEIRRIEALLTTFNDQSQTAKINENAGKMPVEVDQEVLDLIFRAKKISQITQGAFDISYGSIDKSLWNFDTHMTQMPDQKTAKKMVRLINYQNIVLDLEQKTVFLKEKGMRIGFGGIGKGYAADQAKKIMQNEGIESGIVNASGDLITWGNQPNGKAWTVGIADPNTKNPFSYLQIGDQAIATSGNYEKFAIINGKRYSHTINPKTGFPVQGIKSVSIICPTAELADAFATPITVMGVSVGLHLVNQIKNMACIIVDDQNKIFTSKNIKIT